MPEALAETENWVAIAFILFLGLLAYLGAHRKIIGALDDQKISVRRAQEITGFAAADFSRVRQAKVQRFTIDRLMTMLVKLNKDVEISIDVHPRRVAAAALG